MNTNIDMIQILADLPKAAREGVLFSLTGSANASVISNAQFIVGVCESNGLDVQDEVELHQMSNIKEIAHASTMSGQNHNWFDSIGVTVTWANQLRDIMLASTNKDQGGLQATLDFMSSKPRLMKTSDAERTAAFLNSLDDDGITGETIKAIFDTDALKRCEDLKTVKHRVEVIMNALPATDTEDPFSALTERQQDIVVEKMITSLNKARNQLMLSVARGGSGDIGDYAIINANLKLLKGAQPSKEDLLKAAGRARNEEPNPAAPVHNVVLDDLRKKYSAGKLAKPKAVAAVREYMKINKFEAGQLVNSWPQPKNVPKRVPAAPEKLAELVTQ